MIIYSVTITVDAQIEADWLSWMQSHHIQDVMKTGYFSENHLQKLLDPAPSPGTATYNVQYHCESLESLSEYQKTAAPALQQEHTERYRDRFVAFRTLLERV